MAPACSPELRRHDRHLGAVVGGQHRLAVGRADGLHAEVAGSDQATADHHDLGVEDVDEVGHAERHPPAELREHLERLLVALGRGLA